MKLNIFQIFPLKCIFINNNYYTTSDERIRISDFGVKSPHISFTDTFYMHM